MTQLHEAKTVNMDWHIKYMDYLHYAPGCCQEGIRRQISYILYNTLATLLVIASVSLPPTFPTTQEKARQLHFHFRWTTTLTH